jgi:hypothetical protein
MVQVSLVNPAVRHPTRADAARIQDILWAHLEPGLGVEHIRVTAGFQVVDVAFFIKGDGCGPTAGGEDPPPDLTALLSHLPSWTKAPPP